MADDALLTTVVIDGHTVTANPTALAVVGGTTLLNDGSGRTAAGLGGLILGALGSGGPFGAPSSSAVITQGNDSSTTLTTNSTSTSGGGSVQVFEGDAVGRKGLLLGG